jgi:hypothetical protein
MFCIHSNISNKPALIVDDMSTSTLHASDSELDIMPVVVDTAYLENSSLNNHVMIAFQILHVFLPDISVHCALIKYAYI